MLKKISSGIDGFSRPFLESLKTNTKKDVLIGILIFAAAFGAYAGFSTEALINGDAALYVQQIRDLNFTSRAVHMGYFMLGAVFTRIIPFSQDHAANLTNCLMVALSVMLVYLITVKLTHRYISSVIAAALLLVNYLFMENSVYAEVYTPQVCFLLLAILLWLLNHSILAGVAFVISFLMTASTLFALPMFFLLRPKAKPTVLFLATVILLMGLAIVPVYNSYFHGGRGLLKATDVSVNVKNALNKESYEIFYGFFLALPFVILGLAESLGRKALRPFGLAVISLLLLNFILGEKFPDVPVQLPGYALLCCLGGVGINLGFRVARKKIAGILLSLVTVVVVIGYFIVASVTGLSKAINAILPGTFVIAVLTVGLLSAATLLLKKVRHTSGHIPLVTVALLVIVVNGYFAFYRMDGLNKYHVGYRDSVLAAEEQARPEYLVIGTFTWRILFEHYIFGESYTPNCFSVTHNVMAAYLKNGKVSPPIERVIEGIRAKRDFIVLREYGLLLKFLQANRYRIFRCGSVYLARPVT